MNGDEILSQARERLTEAVLANPSTEPLPPALEVSPWLAMSLLQKAIRRGRTELALRAAATLLTDAPDRLWRRLGIIAFEDVGVADLETLSLTTAALTGKSHRAKLGGEWAVARTLISRMAEAPKCRAADDLVMVVQHHPGLRQARDELMELTTRELVHLATGSAPLLERALALWLAIGTVRCPSDHLPLRCGEPDAVFDTLCDAGLPDTAVEVCREGLRKLGLILCPLVSLLTPMRMTEPAHLTDDELPPELPVGGVPSWAYDMFVREGRQAMRVFLQQDSATARWIRRHVPPTQHAEVLGNLLFAAEGGLLSSRLDWPTGAEVRRLAEHESQGPHCPEGAEVIALLRGDLPLLNRIRAQVGSREPRPGPCDCRQTMVGDAR
ncbi:hypothetical protein [Methylobacterium nodulans]|uniref:Uncharacterized protein n=1 Tax=Methylobacterium nodulans (strain LMG 21967 / CNCM I-2342 / ORS 2060) TaxID=460265 RepID=B8IGN6_METNO|nr:hypothetical protein [Methylobacterium nodulans]ACL55936.1 conserved hypothetical protein [Methylobacterium nodulans ORS 2060]